LDVRQPVADPANSGIRREPELPESEDISPEVSPLPPEFDFAEDEGESDAIRARELRRNVSGLARQAAMDPGDGLDL
jgi:type IV secretion system protein VirD4